MKTREKKKKKKNRNAASANATPEPNTHLNVISHNKWDQITRLINISFVMMVLKCFMFLNSEKRFPKYYIYLHIFVKFN